MAIRTKLTPSGQLQLSTPFLIIAGLAVLLLIGLLVLAQRAVPSVGALLARTAPEPMRKVDLPESLKPKAQPYAALRGHSQPPVAQPVAVVTAVPPPAPPAPPPPPGVVQAQATPTPSFIDLWQKQQEAVARTAQQPQQPQQPQAPTQAPVPKAKREWVALAVGKKQDTGSQKGELTDDQKKALREQGEGRDLIHRANWAIPEKPLRTWYRSQTLACRLLQNMTSETGGQVKLLATTPVLDKFGYDQTVIPKDTIVIASQVGTVRQGSTRLQVQLEQLEFPSGEIVSLKADVGSQDGANGLKGTVDNHVGKLILATGLSAILNIGVRSAAGTPGQGQYFASPLQSAAGDIGSSVQRDTQSIIDRELKIPPTVTIDKNKPDQAFCTVNIKENIQFNKPAYVVR